MASFYEDLQVDATALIQEFQTGQVAFWTPATVDFDPTAEDFNPLNAFAEEDPEPNPGFSVACVVTGYASKYIDGDRIRAGDRKVIMDAKPFTTLAPDTGDSLTIDGVPHVIIEIKPTPAAGTAVIYTAQARTA